MHKMTKATAISKATKDAVYKRDGGHCIICGSMYGQPNAHVVRRSRGGIGIEQNIVTLCPFCHREFDEGRNRELYGNMIVGYLKEFYPDWDWKDMVYRKGAL